MLPYSLKTTDILIIGAGCAGSVAAIYCAQKGLQTTIVSKGSFGKSGITAVGFNGFGGNFKQPDDSPDLHLRDIVISGKYLCDQDVVEQLTNEAENAFKLCEKKGVIFNKDNNSNYIISPTPGCKTPRLVAFSGGGFSLLNCFHKAIQIYTPSPISIKDDFIITKILTNDKRVCGAIGIDQKQGAIVVFRCKSIIMAGGGAGYLWPQSDCPPESLGDIYSLALRAGMKIVNMEQQLHYPTVGLYPGYIKGLCASYEWILDAINPSDGGLLYNNSNQVFYPLNKVGTRDEICFFLSKEINEGRGTPEGGVYLDATKCTDSRKNIIQNNLLSYKRFLDLGIDILKERIQVAPAAHTTLGGIKINKKAETSLKGVFACGECTGNVHGANRLSGHSYLDAVVFGNIAAESACNFINEEGNLIPLVKDQVEEEYSYVMSFLDSKKKADMIMPIKFKNKLSHLVGKNLGLIRDKMGLEETIQKTNLMRNSDLQLIGAPRIKRYNVDWIECIEARHMIDCAEVIARCALVREESRGTHYREDFPMMNNIKPIKHTVAEIIDGMISVRTEEVTMTKYKPETKMLPVF